MKKFVKPLIIAASVACIGGVGAVSFAAWQNTNHASVGTDGTTGSVSLFGFESDTATGFTELMPWDQERDAQNPVVLSAATYKSVALPAIESDDKTYTIQASSDETLTGTVYIKLATTAPTTSVSNVADLTTDGWVALTGSLQDVVASATGDTTYTAYFVLDSSANADMGQSFNVTISIAEVSA